MISKAYINSLICDTCRKIEKLLTKVEIREVEVMPSNLEKIRELTLSLADFTSDGNGDAYVRYEVDGGVCHGYNLFSVDEIAVQRCFCPKGTAFLEHKHDETEYLIFYQGRGIITIQGAEKEFIVGSCFIIKPGEKHSLIFNEDTWVVGATIPKAEGYPK